MKSFIKNCVMLFMALCITQVGIAQSKHLKTADVKIYGNCGMCKKTIEKAGNIKGIAKTVWDPETEIAQIVIDSSKTSIDKVLQRIAAVGYDSEKYRAPDAVYHKLHACCQYDRPSKKDQP